jgi:ubiquinone/menaquinone biosynthesis C-methylase UbiE
MVDYHQIYHNQAADYERLVAREDYRGQIGPALAQIWPAGELVIVELGAGTGRLTRLLLPSARLILAMDAARPMLEVAQSLLAANHQAGWQLAQADNRRLPVADSLADMAVAGWSLGHLTGWYGGAWPAEIGRALAEMKRVVRPGGVVAILETLGTGRTTPRPPTPALAAYYAYLEEGHGFQRTWLRTDYRFTSLTEAIELTRFFFGPELADRVAAEGLLILPECTGLWWVRQ